MWCNKSVWPPLGSIALGTIVAIVGYHLVRTLAPAYMRDALVPGHSFEDGTAIAVGRTGDHSVLEEDDEPERTS